VEAVALPRAKPPFKDIRVDAEGRIWLRRHVQAENCPASEGRAGTGGPPVQLCEPATYDVFTSEGSLLATVTLPWYSYLLAARGRSIWLLIIGQYDVNYVARFRVESS
jgi:hypothetical protein